MFSLQKISTKVLIVIAALSVIISGFYFFGGVVPGTEYTSVQEPLCTNIALIWAFALLIFTVAIASISILMNIIRVPGMLKKMLIISGVGLLLLTISFFMASSGPIPSFSNDYIPTSTTIKLVGTGLNATYIITAVAVLVIIVTELLRAFK